MASYKVIPNVGGDVFPGVTPRTSLMGWSISSTAGATVNFRDGGLSGPIVASVVLAATSVSNVTFEHPVSVDDGIYVQVASGSVTNLAVYVD